MYPSRTFARIFPLADDKRHSPFRTTFQDSELNKQEFMTTPAPPTLRIHRGIFVVELGSDYSHLYESMLNDLALLPLLAASIEPAELVIDLSPVEFLGSAAIGHFVSVAKTLNARGGSLRLAAANNFCRTAISLSKLESLMPCIDSVDSI